MNQQEIGMDHLNLSFDWERLDNGNDSSLHKKEGMMSSLINGDDSLDDIETLISSDVLFRLHSLDQGHQNKYLTMRGVSGEVKNDAQAQELITASKSTNQKNVCVQPNSSPVAALNRSNPYFGENQETKYENENHFTTKMNQITFSDEHGNVHDKSNKQCLSSRTKHTDSCNEASVKKYREQHCSTAPNSDQSIIPLKYTKLMRGSILSWSSQRNLEDEDDESNDSAHRELLRDNVATNDQILIPSQDITSKQIYAHHHLTLTPMAKDTNPRNEGCVKKCRLSHIQTKVKGEVYIETETSRREYQSIQYHPKRLCMPNDKAELNSVHCFVRKELLELFFYKKGQTIVAQSPTKLKHNKTKDGYSNTKNGTLTSCRNDLVMSTFNASPLTNNHTWNDSLRVGFRCVYCARLHQMPSEVSSRNTNMRMNAFYPKSLAHMYRLVCKWQRIHFRKCKHVPLSVKKRYEHLKASDKTRGKTSYWVSSAIELGLIDDSKSGGGIKYNTKIR